MIIIKFKKSILICTSLVIISLAIFTCPVLGRGRVDRPVDYFIYWGDSDDDLDSLKYNDGDIFHLTSDKLLGMYVFFDYRGYVGTGNGVGIKFKFSGPGDLYICIRYSEGHTATEYNYPPTGGDYVTVTCPSDDYKSVESVEFLVWSGTYLYIDFVAVAYGQF